MKVFHPLSTAAVITCLLSVHIHTTLGWRYPADGIEEGFEEHIVTRELNCNRALLPLLVTEYDVPRNQSETLGLD